MPFSIKTFQEKIESSLPAAVSDELRSACLEYADMSTPVQKAGGIQKMMLLMDQSVDEETRREVMEACGRRCMGMSVLKKARQIQKEASDLDDLLQRLNEAHIGGGHMYREGSTVHAMYTRCYCGTVSQTREPISVTYCSCSCGWFRQLFESLMGHPVEVRLLDSIIQGGESCQFLIELQTGSSQYPV
jgi:predicted hydrocarbon binding protein